MKNREIPENVEAYIKGFPPHMQKQLQELRKTIRKAAPEAVEKISYQMPAFSLKGILVYFAAFKNHIGFYPGASAIKVFINELSSYHTSKGTIHFSPGEPLPVELITRIVSFRVSENLYKAEMRNKKVRK